MQRDVSRAPRPPSVAERDALKAAELRRMQRLATALLAAMLALLLVSASLQDQHPWLRWVRAFAEAGAVGAMADWYAVVALFRYPLGLPIPHTAIVVKRKDEIGVGLGEFIEQNFLTPENILRKLEQQNAAQALAHWLAVPANSEQVARSMAEFAPALLAAAEDEDLARFLDRAITPQLLRLDPARLAAQVLGLLTADGRHQVLLDRALQLFEAWLDANQGLILAKFAEASRYTPPVLDAYIVEKFVAGLVALLHEVAATPEHALRRQFDAAVLQFVDDLRHSGAYRAQGRALLRDVVAYLRRERYDRRLWQGLRERIETDLRAEGSALRQQLALGLQFVGRELLADSAVQAKLNGWWLQAVRTLVLRYRHQISALITEVVRSWEAEDVSRKLELEIGKDLQYIRINGTLVGGMAGVLLHALTSLLAR
jgi:uncharacterized membrane-anchored protein YjiN (DUF445 family)